MLLGLAFATSAQSYSVALIPDSLKNEARAVMREDETILEIKSPEKAIEKTHRVFTIINENGGQYRRI